MRCRPQAYSRVIFFYFKAQEPPTQETALRLSAPAVRRRSPDCMAIASAARTRPREAAARFDLAARLRGFAAARRDAGGAKDAEASAEAERLAARLEA